MAMLAYVGLACYVRLLYRTHIKTFTALSRDADFIPSEHDTTVAH
jgi:hypothetical protein